MLPFVFLVIVSILVSISFNTIVKNLLLGVRGKYLGCFLLSRVHSSLHKAAPNIHKCLSLERRRLLHLYSSFLLRPSIMGFMCPNIMDCADPHSVGEAERAPGSFLRPFIIPLVHTKTSFDSRRGYWLSLLQLGLALCWKFCSHTDGLLRAACLSVFVF